MVSITISTKKEYNKEVVVKIMFLYTENMMKFAFSTEFTEEAEEGHVIMGVPFDSTTSYKSGSRYGPKAVREASYNFESYNINLDETLTVNTYDIGDVNTTPGNYQKTHEMIKDTIKTIQDMNLKPITIGGEHTISIGVLEAIHEQNEELYHNMTIVHLDAHLDMRDEYLGEKYSHATVLRRAHQLKPKQIIQLGIRSAQKEEYEYTKQHDNIQIFTSRQIKEEKTKILEELEKINTPIYITVDIDVLDPSYAPSVGTPSPCGITPFDLEDIIQTVAKKETIGLDVVEVSSDTIGDVTSVNASKVIYDYLCLQK